jgi:cell division protein YceG involved in septum cleavage
MPAAYRPAGRQGQIVQKWELEFITKSKKMKILKSVVLFLVFIILSTHIYCQKIELKTSPLHGSWIEVGKKTDTIVFSSEYDGQNPIFELKRGFRITEGYKLPNYFSGPYNFKLGNNSISVYWFLSSGSFQSYYFKMIPGENKFKIGNFFKDPEKKNTLCDTLIFMRIK